jgi:hypothetical protein
MEHAKVWKMDKQGTYLAAEKPWVVINLGSEERKYFQHHCPDKAHIEEEHSALSLHSSFSG